MKTPAAKAAAARTAAPEENRRDLVATATLAARRIVAMTAAKSAYTAAIMAFMTVLPISPDLFAHSFFAGPIRRGGIKAIRRVSCRVTSP
jgi:hypothetical protein